MKKLYIPKLNGFVWIETYNGKKEEWDRAKIYDENGNYLDYISLDGVSKQQYKDEIKTLSCSKDFEEFVELLGQFKYDYSESLEYLLWSIFDSCDEESANELDYDLKNLTEPQIIEKYMINRVGDYYFYLGDY